jgi:arylsulfatase A-like enzyme
VFKDTGMIGSLTPDLRPNRLRLGSLLLVSAWCGLVAGVLEVGALVLRKRVFDSDQLYKMSRHFVWLVPLSNLCVFLTLGLLAWAAVLLWPRRGRWLFLRGTCALALLPPFLVAFPRIYAAAWLVVVLAVAARLVPTLERHSRVLWRAALISFPAVLAIVAILGASLWAGDRIKQAHESARPRPPAGSPNILLIVMDTVAAGHLNLHGYDRATSTTLNELALRGVRFESARAASSWTLPSHASMFTGRWLHELSVGWLTPLDQTHPTLAEFLGDRGYATAGFVANTTYCAADSGLARGFTHYRDFIFPELTALKTAVLVNRALRGFQAIVSLTENWLDAAGLLRHVQRIWQALDTDRKPAAVVNGELLDWLSERSASERPFFAFVNYFDAHHPYQLPPDRLHRFGAEPTDSYHRVLVQHWWELDKQTVPPAALAFASDLYDDCVADLDEALGSLVDELHRRGILEQTWLFITSDHGESFGEHAGVFCHGRSLYDTELHVPLVILPPARKATGQAVREPVSLQELAATIVDVAGIKEGAPFPGRSLARFWNEPGQVPAGAALTASPTLAEVVPLDPLKRDSRGAPRQLLPLGAVKERDWSYIRRERDVHEELFDLRSDPSEQHNLAAEPDRKSILDQLRSVLDRLTDGPLVPERFGHD